MENEEALQNAREPNQLRWFRILLLHSLTYQDKLKETLISVHSTKNNLFNFNIYGAECVEQVLQCESNVPIDFIVFMVDTSCSKNIKQLQYDLNMIDKNFLIGRTCIVHHTNFFYNDIQTELFLLADSLKIPVINGDIRKPNKCKIVAQRILTLIEVNLLMDIPLVPWLSF